MNFSIQAIIRGLVAPNHTMSCPIKLWQAGLMELKSRGRGRRESGAFLLGKNHDGIRRVCRFVYYDDLDPHCLDQGYVVFDGSGYSDLWQLCEETGLTVIADIHTHPGAPFQSQSDRCNPMVALQGHIALIVPDFATRLVLPGQLGIYEYEGEHRWKNHTGKNATKFFYIGMWS